LSPQGTAPPSIRDRDAVHIACAAVGTALLLFGILGFVPGLVSDLDRIAFAGHRSGAELLGVFQVSVLHNLIHLAFGVAGLAMAGTTMASAYLLGGGTVYAAYGIYGMLVHHESGANFVPFNHADNWLHLGLGAGMVVLGAAFEPARR
jgi:hypothetical protein